MQPGDSLDRCTDDQLLREANQGNAEAFGMFCVRSLPSLMRYVRFQCRQLNLPKDLANDFCQDTFLKAVNYINSCRVQGDRPLPKVSVAWLNQIAYNSMLDWLKRSGRVECVEASELDSRTSTDPNDVDEFEELHKFFQWLTPNEHDLLHMVYVESVGIVEAGERLNLSSAAAYKTHHRGLERLRDLLREYGKCVTTGAVN